MLDCRVARRDVDIDALCERESKLKLRCSSQFFGRLFDLLLVRHDNEVKFCKYFINCAKFAE